MRCLTCLFAALVTGCGDGPGTYVVSGARREGAGPDAGLVGAPRKPSPSSKPGGTATASTGPVDLDAGVESDEDAGIDATADLRVTLTWDALGLDFELHLIRQGGHINDGTNDCTWTTCIGRSPDWGVAGDPRDDPMKDADNVGNFGPETILLVRASPGTYTVMVEHWGSGASGAEGEVSIETADHAPVSIPIHNLAPQWVFTAATIRFPGGAITPVGRQFDCTQDWSAGCQAPIP